MMRQIQRHLNFQHRRRGFSMTELAIVMGVIMVIVSGIWASLGMGRQSASLQQQYEQIQIVVNNVRGYYAGQVGLPAAVDTAITSNLITIKAIPADMQRTAISTCTNPSSLCADTVW